ncbi:spore germination protein GerA [Alkalihalobacillus alcalophilus ATCC 27647 = CGMCC 1.3604]|uniref:Spore germination protein GerA n=1 Tax=Alkalihalobacillus alcalophilus ATCC 27647 = CGMCC 1.3604 TaxID=1218173 RepID=A0A094WMC4_ALKAL|nr:spore germination protein [Alkalihalobacillus alcalophilus]KGA98899.1 spore gernimation protein GerA [Alkalihalobacillus alcalophilus ATCC 27647 = CGMCC 1.3604]MED1560539.1 spore germination protein [Alkalihalobacillus alcalophilus]THG91660.1 spore germination protein GerA [Alkalihalobacillus alcalophilus ATCC 27647 = CGMCC 1.3604]
MSFWKRKKVQRGSQQVQNHLSLSKLDEESQLQSVELEQTITYLIKHLGEDDFNIRRFKLFGRKSAAILYIKTLVHQPIINEVFKPLMIKKEDEIEEKLQNEQHLMRYLTDEILYFSEVAFESRLSSLVQLLLQGETLIVVDGCQQSIHIGTQSVEKRSVDQPETEQVIIGPREGFIERLETNIGLIRYRLQSPHFRIRKLTLGRMTQTQVAICYLEGTTNQEIVEEVEKRLKQIDTDAILDIGYLEQFIEDNHFSPFPQTKITERPDSVVGNMIEGRVAILCDGSPFALFVPVVFQQFIQTTEDYSSRFLMGSFIRLIRYVALLFSLIFPALYVSFISFNPELIPTEFAVAVAGGRAGVPYPAVVEVLLIETAMEVLREATVRLPKQFGGAISIVGVLVIGEAAVSAGLSSPVTVVVIALTTIGSFATPAYSASFALRLLRFPLVILAGLFGLYGVIVGVILILNHMLSLKSFGVPYMSPISPENIHGMKDTLIRSPIWWVPRRPAFLHSPNERRLNQEFEKIQKRKSKGIDESKIKHETEEGDNGASS